MFVAVSLRSITLSSISFSKDTLDISNDPRIEVEEEEDNGDEEEDKDQGGEALPRKNEWGSWTFSPIYDEDDNDDDYYILLFC